MKQHLIPIIAFLTTLLALSTSCKKTATTYNVKQNASIGALADSADMEEVAYEKTLDAVTYGLLDLGLNSQFKSVVNTEVLKQFDGDDNVLLLTLKDELSLVGINLLSEMTSSLNNHNKSELIPYLMMQSMA